jgi:uncharacterized C2H2 Zn-finger protein
MCCDEAAVSSSEKDDDEFVFLTLGDGDFSWSLDFARFLLENEALMMAPTRRIRLVATGADMLEDLQHKYRDTPHILRELVKLNGKSKLLKVQVMHDINAILPSFFCEKNDDEMCSSSLPTAADVVIFHHPHLGVEDAVLHTRFLCHLFHAVRTYWLRKKEGSVFHLTLAAGQCERWQCLVAAERHSMVLVNRSVFKFLPVDRPAYQHRRHQTGKSFAKRTAGASVTFTFRRRMDDDRSSPVLFEKPIWCQRQNGASTTATTAPIFSCPFCDKIFREERSVRNHVKNKHGTNATADGNDKKKVYQCDQCQKQHGKERRIFETPEALQDHVKAKHEAIHTTIHPDWYHYDRADAASSSSAAAVAGTHEEVIETTTPAFGNCAICGQTFGTADERKNHLNSFVPSSSSTADVKCSSGEDGAFRCPFCGKSFRQKRAVQQHENVCSSSHRTARRQEPYYQRPSTVLESSGVLG